MSSHLEHGTGEPPGKWSRRSARAAFLAAFGSVTVPVVFAGLHALTLLVLIVGALTVGIVTSFWFLTSRGITRWISLGVLVLTPIAVVTVLVRAHLLWVVLLASGLAVLAGVCARAALGGSRARTSPERPVPPPRRPFLVMNPRSGGGKVGTFDLQRRAEALGAEVVLIEGPGTVDIAAVTRDAVARGADLLGVAGGDGTQALVAGIAAAHDLPFLVISAGTRNHFAADLGLDLADPSTCLDALRDGTELRIDLGAVDGRTFVNNASFGVYARIVQSPAYRRDKTATILQMLPDMFDGHSGARLVAHPGGATIEDPQAVLVSNGPYEMHDLAGLGRRARLDSGTLGVVTIRVGNARQAVGLLRRAHRRGLTQHTVREILIEADAPEIPVGVDGEALLFPTPVRCTITPGALRVRLPRNRPGVRAPERPVDWILLRQLAFSSNRPHR
ncbi:diacylglycerol/lipid kinase family protein [Nocardia sp. NPDC001965]